MSTILDSYLAYLGSNIVKRVPFVRYIACLLRHILSSETTWKMQDPRVFNSPAFFNKCVGALAIEAIKGPILAFFQYNVYGTVPGDNNNEDDPDDDLAALRKEFPPAADPIGTATS